MWLLRWLVHSLLSRKCSCKQNIFSEAWSGGNTPPFSSPGLSIFPTDLPYEHSFYMLITGRSGEFVSGDTSGTQWDHNSLCGNVQIYQVLLAVINLLWKHWVGRQERGRWSGAHGASRTAQAPKGQEENQPLRELQPAQDALAPVFYPSS